MGERVCPNCDNVVEPGAEICVHCGMALLPDMSLLQSGALLQGRYEIIELLHVGGMGYVYLAKDRKVYDRKCIIKQVKSPVLMEADHTRLRQEAARMARLYHPNVASIYEDFEDGGYYFLAVQYVEGKNLSEIFQDRDGKISEGEVLNWAIAMCDVVTYMHKEGVIHRDISPDNVMLTPENTIMFIDFGTTRDIQEISFKKTAGAGKFGFTPLEQWLGKPALQSDIFAIGATIYYLLTGYVPVSAEYKITTEPQIADYRPEFPPIRTRRSDVSRGMETILQKALAIEIKARYQSARELRDDLAALSGIKAADGQPKEAITKRKGKDKQKNGAGKKPGCITGAVTTILFCSTIIALIFSYAHMIPGEKAIPSKTPVPVSDMQLNKMANLTAESKSPAPNRQIYDIQSIP